MLPKSARMFLFAAVLAGAHAHGAPSTSGPPTVPGTCAGGRIESAVAAAAFAGCRAIQGDLTIQGTDLSDLSALSELRSVSGALTIRENPNLRNLEGLERLERAGSFSLRANGLYGTRGLEGLRRVGTLAIESNRLLISLRGFRNVERVDTLVVSNNPRVSAQLGLFPSLSRIERSLTVVSNFGLAQNEVATLVARTRGGRP